MSPAAEAGATPAGAPPPTASTRSARLVAAGILLSRIAGLVRTAIFAHYLGASVYASAFTAALRMPNVLQNLLGEGTLSASFIPVYAGLLERGDREAAGRLAGAVFALLLAVAGGLAILGALAAPLLVHVFVPDFSPEAKEVTAACLRVIFPMTGVLVLSAWALGVLNSHRSFFLPYVAPVLWNAAMIATLVAFGANLAGRSLVIALAWGALAGGVLQFLVQIPRVRRLEGDLRIRWDTRDPAVRTVVRNAGPAILGRGAVQLSGWADLFLASFLFDGAVAVLGYAQTLYLLPVSLFGMSIAVAELPEMSRAGQERLEAIRARLDGGLRRVAALVAPSAIGYLLLGDVIVAALFGRGRFAPADTLIVALTLAAYSIGLVASTATRLHSSALYALQDTRTPARIAFIRVTLSAAVGATLMLLLERYAIGAGPVTFTASGEAAAAAGFRPLGAVGLALGAAVGAWVEWLLLRRATQQRAGPRRGDGPRWAVLLSAAVLPALAARAVAFALPPLPSIPAAMIVLGVYGAGYLLLARLFGIREVFDALGGVGRRLGAGRR